jgi:hypothetical protein
MYGDIGEFFFHYTKADTAFRHILPSGKLRLSSYRRMQDPPEAHPWTFAASYSPDAIDNNTAAERWTQLSDLANQVKDSAKLLSLTDDAPGWEDPFGRGYARASMWELYAKQHTGACLLFDRARLIEVLTPQLRAEGQAFDERVRYTISPTRDIATPKRYSHSPAQFSHCIVRRSSSQSSPCAFEDSLRAVFVGERFPEGELDGAMRAAKDAKADVRRLRWTDGIPWPKKIRS